MTLGVLLMLTFPGASTVQVLYAVQIPISLGGNFGLLLAASFSYIGDVSIKNTFFFSALRCIPQISGQVLGNLVFKNFGSHFLELEVLSI